MQNTNRIGRFVPLMLLFILGACNYNFPEQQSFQQRASGPAVDPLPDTGVVAEDGQPAITTFLTQTEGDDLETGINFDTINNEAGSSGIVGRLREIFQADEPDGAFPVQFRPRAAQNAVSKGVDFNFVTLSPVSGTESLNDKDFAFMGFGYDGYQRVVNNQIEEGYRFVGYAGYNLASIEDLTPQITPSATYNGSLGVIAVSDNTATEGVLNAENLLNISTDIVLTVGFDGNAGTLTTPSTNFTTVRFNAEGEAETVILGSVVVNGEFTSGQTALSGTVDFILPSIFTRDNNAPIRTTLQGVIDRDLAIGAFHGTDASVAIIGGFVAEPQ